jgi:quercetin dioxygenase-like cupin family protein
LTDRFEDGRGVIQDLLGPVDAVTEIFTCKDAVRGNHVHLLTEQWTYVVYGSLLSAVSSDAGVCRRVVGHGDLIFEPPGMPHAWRALEDTKVLVFTRGPRSGESYETDTMRLPPGEHLL